MTRLILRITIITVLSMGLFGCSGSKSEESKPIIAVSILPQEYFLKQIAGEMFSVNVMIPPGASPATYEPTPSQLAGLSRADLYLKMGFTGFEMAWMEKISATNKEMKIVNLSEGIDLIMEGNMQSHDHQGHGHHHGGIDPHTWLSPKNALIISENILNALSSQYPEQKETFQSNYKAFTDSVAALDAKISSNLSNLNSRAFFTYHPSLSYFSRDYNLDQYPLELGGKTPSSAHLRNLIDIGREQQIKVVFLQMQFDQKNAEVLAKEIDAEIVQINPLDPEWYKQMLFLSEKIKENLQ